MLIMCDRLGSEITDYQCCEMIVRTVKRVDLRVCMQCEHGRAIAALCPYQPLKRVTTNADIVLPDLLRYSMKEYPGRKTSVNLLVLVAKNQGIKMNSEEVCTAAKKAGLEISQISGRPFITVDDTAQKLAQTVSAVSF